MHIRNDPSFFLTNKTGAPQGEGTGSYKAFVGKFLQLEGHLGCSQANGSKVEERFVQLRMEVRFEVLIEKKKMYYLGLRRFDLWMEFLMVYLEELGLRK
ncbi:hypothetical protein Tco_1069492 [Tanacetum coccineum]|uniref:Uncharacterized protein n=1 Tax=Tanacetum coccineum TaxID=301880 RepID=A0ABQ5HJ54_9ASTR